jgi:2-oxoglutarate ferredoxin oxidoreductase subunit gamma
LIISEKPIYSPSTQYNDILISLFQSALDRYIGTLKTDGTLIVDPKLVTKLPANNFNIYQVPATETAIQIGNRIAANMVILGFLQPLLNVISDDDLRSVIEETVKEKFIDLNLKAFNAGLGIAKKILT